MYMKTRKFNRWKFLFFLYIFYISAITPSIAMSESAKDNSKLKITQTVISKITSSIPLSIKKICVLEVFPDQSAKPLELKYLDNRIVTDNDICYSSPYKDRTNITVILFINDVNIAFRKEERPSGQYGEVHDRIIKYLDAGKIVAMAALDKSGADVNAYVFEVSENGPQLIESAVIDKVEIGRKTK